MRLKLISYKVTYAGHMGMTSVHDVAGYAVDTIARICVRKTNDLQWVCDDYDTGLRIGCPTDTQKTCIENAIKLLEKHVPTGNYTRCQRIALDDLKKAGLLK